MIDLKEIVKCLKGEYSNNYFYDTKENLFVNKENDNTIRIIPLSKEEIDEFDLQFVSALNDEKFKEKLNGLKHNELLDYLKEINLYNDYEKYFDKLCLQIAKEITNNLFIEDEKNIRKELIKSTHNLFNIINNKKDFPCSQLFVVEKDNQDLYFCFSLEDDILFLYIFSTLNDYIIYYFKDDLIEHGVSQEMVYSLLQYKSIVFFKDIKSFKELLSWNENTGINFKNSPYIGCFNKNRGETIVQCSPLDEALLLSFMNDLFACFDKEEFKLKLMVEEAYKYLISDKGVYSEIVKFDFAEALVLFPKIKKDYHILNLNVEEIEFKLDCKYINDETCKYFIAIEKNDKIIYFDQILYENEVSYLEMENHLYEHFLKSGVPERILVSDILSFDYLKNKIDYVEYSIKKEPSKLILKMINKE